MTADKVNLTGVLRSCHKDGGECREAERSSVSAPENCLRSANTTQTLNECVIETHCYVPRHPFFSCNDKISTKIIRELKIDAARRRLRRLPGSITNIKWKWKHAINPINCEMTSKATHISSYSHGWWLKWHLQGQAWRVLNSKMADLKPFLATASLTKSPPKVKIRP